MSPTPSGRRTPLAVLVSAVLAATVLAGCTADPARPVTVATTVRLDALDPVAATDPAAVAILHQLYPRLLELDSETGAIVPGLAESAAWESETRYRVTIPAGLRFANDDRLTASDVAFSFERQSDIPGGTATAPLLSSLDSVEVVDETTVVFVLGQPDPSFPQALAGAAGAILDEEVFSADAVTEPAAVVAGGGFAGPLRLTSFDGRTAVFVASDDDPAAPAGRRLVLETGLSGEEAAGRLGAGADAVFGALSAEQRASLLARDGVTTRVQPSGAVRLLAFDHGTQALSPQDGGDAAKALAVRQAVADLIDRAALAEAAPDAWVPEFRYLPAGLPVAGEESPWALSDPEAAAVRQGFGDGAGGADPERAAQRLAAAGVPAPVRLVFSVVPASDDPDADAIYDALEEQLEADGLFDVVFRELTGEVDRELLSEERYPQLGLVWSPLGLGASSWFRPLYATEGMLSGVADGTTDELIGDLRATADPAAQAALVGRLEGRLAARLPAIPLLSGQYLLYLSPDAGEVGDIPELGWFEELGAR